MLLDWVFLRRIGVRWRILFRLSASHFFQTPKK